MSPAGRHREVAGVGVDLRPVELLDAADAAELPARGCTAHPRDRRPDVEEGGEATAKLGGDEKVVR